MSTVDYIVAKMVVGDCLYIPKLWIHQVRSFNRNIAVNIWFPTPKASFFDMSTLELEKNCDKNQDIHKTFKDINFTKSNNVAYYKYVT